MPSLLELSAPVLRAQHSLITGRQCLCLTNSEPCIRRLLDRGIWERVDAGLYGPTGTPMYWRRSLMAASLLAPDGSLISHTAAAALLGVGGIVEPPPEISIPARASFRRPWVRTHESSDLDLAGTMVIDGIRITDPVRLAVDLGAVVSVERYKHTIRELRYGHEVSNSDLLRAYLRHKRRGRNGTGALRDWLDLYYLVAGVPESGIELVVLDAIIDADLPLPVVQHWVRVAGRNRRIDLAYPELLIAIEVDGRQHRDDPDVVLGDAARTAALEAAGWTVLRIRSTHFASDLAAVLRTLRQLFSR